ncbi:MAG: ABC transporter permease [Acidimicrobiia bacterium]|nr:ABC transporter permease [Acidimicrobiia bacterium]
MMRRIALVLAAPMLAIVIALAVSSVFLLLADVSPAEAYGSMLSYGTEADSLVSMFNRAIPLYISALAVAVGFQMGLFNIGVEGQYRIAAVVAAGLGAKLSLPGPLHVGAIFVIAVVIGMAWIAIPAILKVTRGVHEVIATIMMNAISFGITAWLLGGPLKATSSGSSLILGTDQLPESARFPTLNWLVEGLGVEMRPGSNLDGFLVVAVLLGVAYYVLVWRTRFGYEVRASGHNRSAAEVAGINPKAVVLKTLFLSGGVAGLIGLSYLLGSSPYRYDTGFPQQYGFTGIAVALLGRNHPIGIAIGALLFGFMERSSQILDLDDIPKEIVVIMQGVIVISVVIAYELVRRYRQTQQETAVTKATDLSPHEATA